MVLCNIAYDNNTQGIYFSGQTLSGALLITNEKKRSIKGITLKIEGYAKCKWTEHEGSGKHRRTIYYTGREDYINTFSYLIGSTGGNKIDLAEGVHRFNFVCSLPLQLPTSVESKYGYIRYQIKVEVERPWKTDYKFCFAFTVIKPRDLNYEGPQLRNPLKADVAKSFFLGLSSKSLHMTAQIPFCGFVAGQSIPISVEINNESKVDVTDIVVELVKMIYYNSDFPRMRTRKREERIAQTRHEGVPARNKSETKGVLVIPSVPPTNTGTCRTIQIFYELHVTAKTSGLHRNLTIMLPITIGTVPLSMPYENLYPSLQNEAGWNLQASTSTAPMITTMPSAPRENDLPPPSYHEAMMTTSIEVDDEEGLNDEMSYNPKYPVFNFQPPPPTAPPSYNEKQEKVPF